MKEPTIEQKARAYDEAKSIMEKYLKSGNAGVIAENVIKKAFPELKESKDENVDEKVRKALIKLVTNHASMDLFIEYDIHSYEALAWLEKQSKQKNVWSEEDEAKRNALISLVEEVKTRPLKRLEDWDGYISWLKNLKNHVQPQNSNITDEELAQAKKDAYNDALDKIEYYSSEPTFGDGWDAAIRYLKKRNIMPQLQWKPSNEQITWLYRAADEASKDSRMKQVLNNLLSDLKKLREE